MKVIIVYIITARRLLRQRVAGWGSTYMRKNIVQNCSNARLVDDVHNSLKTWER